MTHAERLREMARVKARNTDAFNSDYAALLDGAEALEREQWRPIETAPKDGTTIEVWWAGEAHKAAYLTQETHGRCDGWFVLNNDNWYGIDDPTHWRPRPAPPEATR